MHLTLMLRANRMNVCRPTMEYTKISHNISMAKTDEQWVVIKQILVIANNCYILTEKDFLSPTIISNRMSTISCLVGIPSVVPKSSSSNA